MGLRSTENPIFLVPDITQLTQHAIGDPGPFLPLAQIDPLDGELPFTLKANDTLEVLEIYARPPTGGTQPQDLQIFGGEIDGSVVGSDQDRVLLWQNQLVDTDPLPFSPEEGADFIFKLEPRFEVVGDDFIPRATSLFALHETDVIRLRLKCRVP